MDNALLLSRRGVLKAGGAALAASALYTAAPGMISRPFAAGTFHGLSVFDDLKYPPDFKHFDYVNPEAPKIGRLNFQPGNWAFNQNTQTFNTLNSFVTRGDAPPRMELCFDSLMSAALDEPDSLYGLVAHSVSVDEGGDRFTFHLRTEARFHDGSPLSAEDVAFSLLILKEKGHPSLRIYTQTIAEVHVNAPDQLTVVFDGSQSRQTVLAVAGLPIFSKAYYADRDFEASTLEPPLGSGPYRVGDLAPGRTLELRRVEDYWAKDLPVNVGHYNFDALKIEFFRERQVAFEAFKKGLIAIREEFTSRTWVTGYDFPAVEQGRAVKRLFPGEKRPKLQGWFPNQRRAKFADARVREAIGLCFDFEWTNKNLFYDAYSRVTSYFDGSIYAATGLPEPGELALLEPFADQLPASVFGEAYMPPVSDGSGSDRKNMRKAANLLKEAGWSRDGKILRDANGAPFDLEFLSNSPSFEGILGKYVSNLKAVGVNATIRTVDPAQFQSRMLSFDFDIAGYALQFSATPMTGLDDVFGSAAAKMEGGRNLAGIENPVVDALIRRAGDAQSRQELIVTLRALDRVLRANHYWIPNWTSKGRRMAFWDMFGWPQTKPDYGFSYETLWWFDYEKAVKIGRAD